jgi:hypothetical protein
MNKALSKGQKEKKKKKKERKQRTQVQFKTLTAPLPNNKHSPMKKLAM